MQMKVILFFVVLVLAFQGTCAKKASHTELWVRWAEKALKECKKITDNSALCDTFSEVVEDTYKGTTENLARAMQKEIDAVTKISLSSPFKEAGEKILKDSIKHIVDNKLKGESKIKSYFSQQSTQWLMNVITDNKNGILQNQFNGLNMDEIQSKLKQKHAKKPSKDEL